jgi:hypothetical protein
MNKEVSYENILAAATLTATDKMMDFLDKEYGNLKPEISVDYYTKAMEHCVIGERLLRMRVVSKGVLNMDATDEKTSLELTKETMEMLKTIFNERIAKKK